MASRVGLVATARRLGACVVDGLRAADARRAGTAMYVVRHDPRLCPSPMCGGYWVALANGARTRCARRTAATRRCYVARAFDAAARPVGASPEECARSRALTRTRSRARQARRSARRPRSTHPAGTAAVSGGYYRVVDTGIRCVRAPCFSYRGDPGERLDPDDRVGCRPRGVGRDPGRDRGARSRLVATKSGLYARGRFARHRDGGRVFRALRLYLRAPQPRA